MGLCISLPFIFYFLFYVFFQILTLFSVFGEDIITLKEYATVQSYIDLNDPQNVPQQKFLFESMWTDYQSQTQDNDYTCVVVTLDTKNTNLLLQNRIELQVQVSIPQDDSQQVISTFDMTQYVQMDENNIMVSKSNEIVAIPENSPVYITLTCLGDKCNKIDDFLQYEITVNSLSKIEDFSQHSLQYIQLREDGYDQSFFMNSQNMDLVNLEIYEFINRASQATYSCSNIQQVKATACVGVMPLQNELKNSKTIEQCTQIDQFYDGKLSFELDSQNADVSTGIIFVRLQAFLAPGFSLQGISQCQTNVRLYRNEYIEPGFQSTRISGDVRTVENPYHFYVDVPAIQMTAAGSDGSSYGDRLILQLSSNQPVSICVSDIVTAFYPTETTTSAGQCNVYLNRSTPGINQTVLYFNNYLNKKFVGNIQSYTRIYLSVYASDNSSNAVTSLAFSLTVAPQVYAGIGDQTIFTWVDSQKHGIAEYVAVAIDISSAKLPLDILKNSSVISGYYCNYSYCRQNIPDSFYLPSIVTYVSTEIMLPHMDNLTGVIGRNVDGGKQVVSLENITQMVDEVYIGVQNRLGKANFNNAFVVYMEILYGSQNELQYQTPVDKMSIDNTQGVIDYYHTLVPYENTELVIYPCRGWPALLLDSVSPLSTPQSFDYELSITNEWGKPISYHWTDERMMDVNQFITVYDNGAYDAENGKFITTKSQMQYQIFVGSQAEENVPGNSGQITITEFSTSGDGKLTVRFYPARQPNQYEDVSELNYYFYVVPYQGSFDTRTDYTPYTKCGVQSAGYSVYSDQYGNDRIIIDNSELEQKGYIEVTNNLPLFQRGANKDTILYVNIFASNNGYQGVLIGKTELSLGKLMAISAAVMVVIIVSLIVVFYALYYRELKRKNQGYNEVL